MALTEYKTDEYHYFEDEDGKYHGEYKRRQENGQLQTHCFYKDDELHGEYKYWDDNGQLELHCFYKNNNLHGEYKQWRNNGQLYLHCFYNNNKKVIDFLNNPEQYPTSEEDKTMFTLKYGSVKWL